MYYVNQILYEPLNSFDLRLLKVGFQIAGETIRGGETSKEFYGRNGGKRTSGFVVSTIGGSNARSNWMFRDTLWLELHIGGS